MSGQYSSLQRPLLDAILEIVAENPSSAVVENLVHAHSHKLLPATLDSSEQEHIENGVVIFPQKNALDDMTLLYDLEERVKHPLIMGRIGHLSSHIRHTHYHDHIAAKDDPEKSVLWWLEDIRARKTYLAALPIYTRFLRAKVTSDLETFNRIEEMSALDYSLLFLTLYGGEKTATLYEYELEDVQRSLDVNIPLSTQSKFCQLLDAFLDTPDDTDGSDPALLAREWVEMTDANLHPSLYRSCMDGESLYTATTAGAVEDGEETSPSDNGETEDSEVTENSDSSSESESQSEDAQAFEDSKDPDSDSSEEDVQDAPSDSPAEVQDKSNQTDVPDEGDDNSDHEALENLFEELENSLEMPEARSNSIDDHLREKEQTKQLEIETLKKASQIFPRAELQYSTRQPDETDRLLAKSLTKMLRSAQWRAPTATKVSSPIPPGKLDSREAVLRAAQLDLGIPVTAEPFRRIVHQPNHMPPLSIGLGCDLSGSMSASVFPMARFIWALNQAVSKVGGEMAAVSFGKTVRGIARPRQKINMVPVLKASANYEAGYEASAALAGALQWMGKKSGVKILILSSDGEWRPEQVASSESFLNRLEREHGVHIFWVPFTSSSNVHLYAPFYQHRVMLNLVGQIVHFNNLLDAPMELGKLITGIMKD